MCDFGCALALIVLELDSIKLQGQKSLILHKADDAYKMEVAVTKYCITFFFMLEIKYL